MTTSNDTHRVITTHDVPAATSLRNVFAGIELPQNPGLAPNNWNSAHQDSYCSESVGLAGPTASRLQTIKQLNPYGFTPVMVCNERNQMIAVSFQYGNGEIGGQYRLIVFDEDLEILSVTPTSTVVPGTFGGGYFFLDDHDDTVVIANGKLSCYPTADVPRPQGPPPPLQPRWESANIVEMVTGSSTGNSLYSALPVWGVENHYWCLLAGSYDLQTGELRSAAAMAVARIIPDASASGGCVTTLVSVVPLPKQWNNNTFAVDEQGAYFVTNGMGPEGRSDEGFLWAVAFDSSSGEASVRWKTPYENSGLLKPGQNNIGSGTTPTLLTDAAGNELAAITDNAYPRVHVLTVDRKTGAPVSQVAVFPPMRGCDEASLIGVGSRIVVENNFGHVLLPPHSQLVPNEPGFDMIELDSEAEQGGRVVWSYDRQSMFAMSMLARESGIIFAYTGDWTDDVSATEGGMYYVTALDSWDGRAIWRLPVGRGFPNAHEFGGVYFNRDGNLYVGTNRYLFAIKAVHDQ